VSEREREREREREIEHNIKPEKQQKEHLNKNTSKGLFMTLFSVCGVDELCLYFMSVWFFC